MTWRRWKSTRSAESANCVQMMDMDLDMVAVQDTKAPPYEAVWFDRAAWREFIEAVKVGEFDR